MRAATIRLFAFAIALISAAGCSGCSKTGPTLAISVLTDAVAGPEFSSVEIELLDSRPIEQGATILRRATAAARFGDAFARGRQVAEFSNMPKGETVVRVRLMRPNGTLLLSRVLRFSLTNNYTAIVPLTRDCIEVECPNAAAPGLSQCLMGSCVDERCNPDDKSTLAYCPMVTFCNTPEDCRPVAECASQVCEIGVCTQSARTAPDEAACPTEYWCDPTPATGGCTKLPETTDGGVDPNEIECDTVCFVAPCKFGAWRCSDTAAPTCLYLGNRPAGTECGFEQVCTSDGDCVGTSTPSDAGAGDAAATSDDASTSSLDASADSSMPTTSSGSDASTSG